MILLPPSSVVILLAGPGSGALSLQLGGFQGYRSDATAANHNAKERIAFARLRYQNSGGKSRSFRLHGGGGGLSEGRPPISLGLGGLTQVDTRSTE